MGDLIMSAFFKAKKIFQSKKWRAVSESVRALYQVFDRVVTVFGFVLVSVLGLMWAAPVVFPESEFAYETRDVFFGPRECSPTCSYVIIDKPHDCDFMSAPLGRKHCRYEKDVSEPFDVTEEVSSADTRRQYRVIVSWNRVED